MVKGIMLNKLINLFWNKFRNFKELFLRSLKIIPKDNGLKSRLFRIIFMLNI